MPKSGQPWDRNFLQGEPLFEVFEPFAQALRTPSWPHLEDYERQLESWRQRATQPLAPLGIAPNPVRSRRAKREKLSLDELYDGRIALTGQVYCLAESFHDLFNVIVFSAFPLAKRALHARQFRAVSSWVSHALESGSPRIPGRRTREQDALTIFDEGGVLLMMSQEQEAAFQEAKSPIVVSPFEPESGIVPILFGHALLEHLHEKHRAIRASGLIITCDPWPTASDPIEWCHRGDPVLAQRIENPLHFQEPKADCIFELARDGRLTIRHSSYPTEPLPSPS